MSEIIKLEWAGGLPVVVDDEINEWSGTPYAILGEYFITTVTRAQHLASDMVLVRGKK